MNNDKLRAIENVNVQAYKKAIGYKEQESTKKLYGIKDIKIGICEVMIGINDGAMVRNFTMAVKDKNTMIGKFPEDFELWKLGEIAEKSGEFSSDLRKITDAKDYVE